MATKLERLKRKHVKTKEDGKRPDETEKSNRKSIYFLSRTYGVASSMLLTHPAFYPGL